MKHNNKLIITNNKQIKEVKGKKIIFVREKIQEKKRKNARE